MYKIICANCRRYRSEGDLRYKCQYCGGHFVYDENFRLEFDRIDRDQPGIWRYLHAFGLPEDTEAISLGEGITPLVLDEVGGKEVAFKLDYLNPTGSYKDRGTSVLISYLYSRGVNSAVEDSSGNAGASFAAYAARAGIHGKVFVPAYASGPKRSQIEAHGVELVSVKGPRSNAAKAVEEEAKGGEVYASHIFQPHVFPGYATLAYELFEQLGKAPGAVITPVGHGSLLLGMEYGFNALLDAGLIQHAPQFVGVQALACAPLWTAVEHGDAAAGNVVEGETIAEGIRINVPLRGTQVIEAVESSAGFFFAVREQDILSGCDELARRGFYVEPTSAVVWPALNALMHKLNDPIVVVLTGSGLKFRA